MGFGLLFLGYFLAFVVFLGHLAVCRALGGVIIAIAAYKLNKYHSGFRPMLLLSLISIIFYGAATALDVLDYVGVSYAARETLASVVAIVDIPLTFVFQASMLVGIRGISRETASEKLYFAASRNLIFYVILLVFEAITLLPFTITRNLSVLAVIFALVLAIFNLVLIFKCYAGICDSADVEMNVRPSRIGFVNSFREEQERRRLAAEEKRAQKKRKGGK